ncbi:SLATT domain-containing protein [Vibrio lentus]|uniref:SLATT domain-containing protein n=1 Tax=Vibrio lentus TaxID=136468 RepID=UPI000C831856|nr:SLATT domain-containing protein [Vibrio lentus]PMM25257.1 hypothetical protein BCT58_00430 [Vibrio lentus]
MNEKDQLKRDIANTAYNIIYGAKLNYSSYELSKAFSSGISYFSLAIGIITLAYVEIASKELSVTLLLLGLFGLLISKSPDSLVALKSGANKLTELHDLLKNLYAQVDTTSDYHALRENMASIQSQARGYYQTDQLLFASWFAHHKLFNEHQSDWMCEALNLTFWKDKVPSTLRLSIKLGFFIIITAIVHYSISINGGYDYISDDWLKFISIF